MTMTVTNYESSDRARELLDKMKARRESLHHVRSKFQNNNLPALHTSDSEQLADDSSIPSEIYTLKSSHSTSAAKETVTSKPRLNDSAIAPSTSNKRSSRAREILYDMKEQRESLTIMMKSATLRRNRAGMASPATTVTKESSMSSLDCISMESSSRSGDHVGQSISLNIHPSCYKQELSTAEYIQISPLNHVVEEDEEKSQAMTIMEQMTCFEQNLCPDCWYQNSNVPMEDRCEEGRFCV
mmetsp:Transcript_775/g.1212  ORF Transcript_775/g.1212 Transcript_775/m.1212 type:complete len:241 (+) Transcript_775:260-982(+)|eukprot:CAMPEP_0195284124 /NCGR_PEP_ID=MMETSP0707-20130614/2438_1 /TAXON_ID=33640 /ORGANISM="Asterionellopsis glacialis, Strain CCMP134" /LENGTH=240 /DNA_ID=CAMNT_0040343425 /DNA_START=196 /DNA_END=918 /DNA_ORIENTATION=+